MSENQKPKHEAVESEDPKKMFEVITERWESTYGHGWKRRLAEFADVPESTVHSWLKARRLPPWLLRIMTLLAENSRFKRNIKVFRNHIDDYATAGQVVKTDSGFAVYSFTGGIGKLVCDNIPDEDTAIEIASLPRLKNIIHRVQMPLTVISDSVGLFHEDDVVETEELLLELSDWARLAVLKDEEANLSAQDFASALGEVLESVKK